MDSSESVIMTILARLRLLLDDADIDAKFSNDFLVRHIICPTYVDVLSRINNTTDAQVILTFNIAITADVKYYLLPPCVQEVHRLMEIDENGRTLNDIRPRDQRSPVNEQWALQGAGGALTLYVPDTYSALRNVSNIQLWYVSNGSVDLHYASGSTVGGSATNYAFATGSWNQSTLTLTKTNAFTGYTWQAGDKVQITAGTNTTKGTYEVTAATASTLTLKTSIGSSATSVSGRLWVRSMTLAGTPTLGGRDRRPNAYCGSIVRIIPIGDFVSERTIDGYDYANGSWTITTRIPFDVGSAASQIPYEIVPSGLEAFVDAITVGAAIKLGAHRKISQAHFTLLRTNYLSALKTIIDNMGQMQLRTPKQFVNDTIDNPYPGTFSPSHDRR
jgi:hypothetical protein